jgi:hypothetical protein
VGVKKAPKMIFLKIKNKKNYKNKKKRKKGFEVEMIF